MIRNLRDDLFAIWNAGVKGVAPERLIEEFVAVESGRKGAVFHVKDREIPLDAVENIFIIGAGKASAGLGIALERILLPIFGKKRISGWLNVPEDCVRGGEKIRIHAARPAGINEPRVEGVHGSVEMVKILESMRPKDLCFCLLSGGGSALLPAPVPQISLEEKIVLGRFLSESGANIHELNTVRKQLSLLKGGGLKRICEQRNLRLITLILSDVPGDPLDIIASGPTVEDPSRARDALAILHKYLQRDFHRPGKKNERGQEEINSERFSRAIRFLEEKSKMEISRFSPGPFHADRFRSVRGGFVENFILGNNALAVDWAGVEAEKRGYSHAMISARSPEGSAEEVGTHLAELTISMLEKGPDCLISGGEPTVRLCKEEGKGGRNQHLVLAALIRFLRSEELSRPLRFAMLSGGTDGEDGPTDAAGAFFDEFVLRNLERNFRESSNPLDPGDFLRRCDSYRFFDALDALLKTGATGTNVCDLRVVVVDRAS